MTKSELSLIKEDIVMGLKLLEQGFARIKSGISRLPTTFITDLMEPFDKLRAALFKACDDVLSEIEKLTTSRKN